LAPDLLAQFRRTQLTFEDNEHAAQPSTALNGGIALWLQSARPLAAVVELGAVGGITRMDTFYKAFGIITAFCAGIIILAVFFTALSYLKRIVQGPGVNTVSGFIREGKRVCVHLTGGRALQRVRFIGFSEPGSVKGGAIPYHLSSMVVFETEQEARILVRADSIRMIEEVADAA